MNRLTRTVVAGVLITAVNAAHASKVVSLKLDEVIQKVSVILAARIEERENPAQGRHSVYRYRVRIEQILVGSAPTNAFDVFYYEQGNPFMSVFTTGSGIEPSLEVGRSYILLFESVNLGICLRRAEPLERGEEIVSLWKKTQQKETSPNKTGARDGVPAAHDP